MTKIIERRAVELWYRIPLGIVILMAILAVIGPTLPELSGRIYPVLGNTKILKIIKQDQWQEVAIQTDKYLACTYVGQAWYWTDADGSTHRIPRRDDAHIPADHDLTRPAGTNVFTVYLQTALPPERWRATVRHRCWPFFDTVSVLWP